jgi:hypothetical protein
MTMTKRRPPSIGELCPANATHGPLLLMRDGALYCPHWAHDAERIKPADRGHHIRPVAVQG